MVATQSLPGLCLETIFRIRTGLGKQTKKKTLDKVRGRSGIWLNLNKKILGFCTKTDRDLMKCLNTIKTFNCAVITTAR